jgi:hypothetical protein
MGWLAGSVAPEALRHVTRWQLNVWPAQAVAALHQALIKAANQRARLEDEWANESAARENAEQLFLADQVRGLDGIGLD